MNTTDPNCRHLFQPRGADGYCPLCRETAGKIPPSQPEPGKLRWTTTRPTKDGWYWCKCQGYGLKEYPTMVKVLNKGTEAFWDGEAFHITSSNFREWSDQPVPEPV